MLRDSHLTTTIFCPLRSCLATVEAKRPSKWPLPSIMIYSHQIHQHFCPSLYPRILLFLRFHRFQFFLLLSLRIPFNAQKPSEKQDFPRITSSVTNSPQARMSTFFRFCNPTKFVERMGGRRVGFLSFVVGSTKPSILVSFLSLAGEPLFPTWLAQQELWVRDRACPYHNLNLIMIDLVWSGVVYKP